MSVFSAKDYRTFLRQKIEDNRSVRGYQGRLATAAGVHSSYISRVVNSYIHLTLDQAANLAEFWRLDSESSDCFVDLVCLERSSSKALQARIQQRLSAARRKREVLAERFATAEAVGTVEQGLYYSAWYFSAIHMLLTIPKYRTIRAISARLRLSENLVQSALETLKKAGLAQIQQGQWRPQQSNLHLSEDQLWARAQHGHWRQKSALKVQEFDPRALHYSGVHTMSEADGHRLKELLVQFLDETRKLVGPSPEENLFFLGCDLYEI